MIAESNEQRIALHDQLEAFRKSDLYQALVVPIEEELQELKASYDCNTVAEIKELKGRRRGLDKINQLMRQIDTDAETALANIKAEDERRRRNIPPADSSEL